MPKKLLVYGAQYSEEFSDAAGFGWKVGETHHDWASLVNHKVGVPSTVSKLYAKMVCTGCQG